MPQFRKKPVVIEARQWASWDDRYDLAEWIESLGGQVDDDEGVSGPYHPETDEDWGSFRIVTLEGEMEVSPLDWIIKGVQGEFYPCKPDIFEATYESV